MLPFESRRAPVTILPSMPSTARKVAEPRRSFIAGSLGSGEMIIYPDPRERRIGFTIWKLVQRIKTLENACPEPRASKPTGAQVAATKKLILATQTKASEIIISPDPRETEIKDRRGSATFRAVEGILGKIVTGARRLSNGSIALKIAPAQNGNALNDGEWISVVFGRARVAKGGLCVIIKGTF